MKCNGTPIVVGGLVVCWLAGCSEPTELLPGNAAIVPSTEPAAQSVAPSLDRDVTTSAAPASDPRGPGELNVALAKQPPERVMPAHREREGGLGSMLVSRLGTPTLEQEPSLGQALVPDLSPVNRLRTPTRLARGPDGRLYVSDATVGSVFILDASGTLIGELSGIDRPLGVAVSAAGEIYVGSHGHQAVEIYDHDGQRLGSLDGVSMPNDLELGPDGTLWVADSAAGAVVVFPPGGAQSWSLTGAGDQNLTFPVALALGETSAGGRLWVADQRTARVHLFDLDGVHLDSWGERVEAFSSAWQGRFVRLQSIALDDLGRLHVLDSYLHRVQIVDPYSGAYLGHYAQLGTDPGELNVPLDLLLASNDEVWIANAGNHRVELIASASNDGGAP